MSSYMSVPGGAGMVTSMLFPSGPYGMKKEFPKEKESIGGEMRKSVEQIKSTATMICYRS